MTHGYDLFDRNRENRLIIGSIFIMLFLFCDLDTLCMIYAIELLYMIIRCCFSRFRTREKIVMSLSYMILTSLQMAVAEGIVFAPGYSFLARWILRAFGVLALLLPLFLERFVTANKNARFYLPSAAEIQAISFAELRENSEKIQRALSDFSDTAQKLSPEKIQQAFSGQKKHSSVSYVNHGSLTEAYFEEVQKAMSDPWIYLVLSDTGSPASEIIGSVTNQMYNHISLSFDQSLHTIVSYNGGANLYPPGLNPEMVVQFHQKPDASVLVYRLLAGKAAKQKIADDIRRINQEGSAYNLVGLVTKWSYKPNIMFCSQFVYQMLSRAGLAYFEKRAADVRPTDFAELDYYRKLKFVEEIRF